ncbi:hypothetical protein BX616_003733 [Lobosporangium transversale]|uniref:Large ribosomal subunit protein mL44 n=1 Tax=Lobosporangium transversale TaxID=64571 RepID=A0A1Y2G8F6_9FUNG|nr:ribonuclease III domain-containing protein [Lobosporangium transversale]KAF9898679.1 hypothetical protein BX616_003733 [Lobosporangium transversale]ORY99622.1 ribonuclease III domain-containing protein [Lobosporangium transversale]|eukprot:XP_021875917.1 ribonuclease III domain-containing protein [Lobosporangium transversale]
MTGLIRSPLVLARNTMRASNIIRASTPTLNRTFLINVKSAKKSKVQQQQEEKSSSPISETGAEAATAAQDSKYRIETPSPAVVAFAHRLKLNKLKDQTLLMRIVTHPSYERVGIQTNARLDTLGDKALHMFVMEYLHVKYPKLPTNVLKEAVEVYTRTSTLELMAKEFGVEDVARWVRSKPDAGHQLSLKTVKASVVRAIVGAIYIDQGFLKAREFVHAHFLSRDFKIESLLQIDEPKHYLSVLMKRLGRERPVARMLAETGRTSKAPIFIVGVYSGTEKIGEGFGSSIKMAEFRANADALKKYYMEELKDFGLPSDTEKEGAIYTPTKIGDTEVVV